MDDSVSRLRYCLRDRSPEYPEALMKSLWIEIARVGLLVAFASSGALAQGAIEPGPGPLVPPSIGAGKPAPGPFVPLADPWTTDNVPADRPFGNIDVSRAGATTAQVRTWAQTRTPMERNELSGRCDVISNPANSSRYPANAQAFCRTYIAMQVITPPPLNLKY
jgi:hypothetical protein